MFSRKKRVDADVSRILPLSRERIRALHLFEKRLGVRFRQLEFLNTALTHKSYSNEIGEVCSNEKMEFLGDSVLELIISGYIYLSLPQYEEGQLTKLRSYVVSEQSLMELAQRLQIQEMILLSNGEEQSGGRNKKAIVADSMEAIIGACYLDSGFEKTRVAVIRWFQPSVMNVIHNRHQKDYKSLLQQEVQRVMRITPSYRLQRTSGPSHKQIFWVNVEVNSRRYGPGKGTSKKEAEQQAAQIAYKRLFGSVKSNTV